MHTYIVVFANGVYHVCYQIPGTEIYSSYETAGSEAAATCRASEMNQRVASNTLVQDF